MTGRLARRFLAAALAGVLGLGPAVTADAAEETTVEAFGPMGTSVPLPLQVASSPATPHN